MTETFGKNLNFNLKNSKDPYHISYCAACNARLPYNALFCPDCDPPLPQEGEPEENGISLQQALLRISILVILFLGMWFIKYDAFLEHETIEEQQIEQLELLNDDARPTKKDFKAIHTVKSSFANIRSSPSMSGKIIVVAKQGIGLVIIEQDDHWSKVQMLGKTGWMSNKLIKSEVRLPD